MLLVCLFCSLLSFGQRQEGRYYVYNNPSRIGRNLLTYSTALGGATSMGADEYHLNSVTRVSFRHFKRIRYCATLTHDFDSFKGTSQVRNNTMFTVGGAQFLGTTRKPFYPNWLKYAGLETGLAITDFRGVSRSDLTPVFRACLGSEFYFENRTLFGVEVGYYYHRTTLPDNSPVNQDQIYISATFGIYGCLKPYLHRHRYRFN